MKTNKQMVKKLKASSSKRKKYVGVDETLTLKEKKHLATIIMSILIPILIGLMVVMFANL